MKKISWKNINSKVKLISVSVIVLMLIQMLVLIIISNNRRVERFSAQATESFSNSIVAMDEKINHIKETAVSTAQSQKVYYMLFSDSITSTDIQSFSMTAKSLPASVFANAKETYVYNEITNKVYSSDFQQRDLELLPPSTTKSIITAGSEADDRLLLFVDTNDFMQSELKAPPQQMLRLCYFPSKQSNSCLLLDMEIYELTDMFQTYKKDFSANVFMSDSDVLFYGSGLPKVQNSLGKDISELSRENYDYSVFRHYDGTKYLVFKRDSENSNFSIFSLIPSDAITVDYWETKTLFSVNICLILLACIAFVLFLLFKNFNQAITENAHFRLLRSEEQMHKQFAQKKQYLSNCLTHPEPQDIRIAEEYIQTLLQKHSGGNIPSAEKINVSLLRIEITEYNSFRASHSTQDTILYKYGVINICEEILNNYTKATLVYERNAELVFLIIENEDIAKKCRYAFEDCRKAVKNYININLSAFLSNNGPLEALPEFNKQIIDLSEYQFLLEEPCFLTADFIRESSQPTTQEMMTRLESLFAVSGNSIGTAELDNLFAELENMRPDDAKNILWIFMFRLYTLGIKNSDTSDSIEELVSRFNEIQKLSQMRDFFRELCSSVFHSNHDSSISPQDYTVITVQAIIERFFREPDFCSDRIAEEMNSSKAYLSRKYKNLTGVSISEEIIARRLKAFANDLVTTDKNVKTIITDIGGTNYNYYMALFKKQYSVTPTEYRRNFKNAPNEF